MFIKSGAHYIVPEFTSVKDVGGDLTVMAAQVRRAIAWVYKNAATFDGDPDRIYIGGHSSGGHLCGVALVTDWEKDYGVPSTIVKGGLCMSGMYELAPVRLSWRRTYVNFTDAIVESMSSQPAPSLVTDASVAADVPSCYFRSRGHDRAGSGTAAVDYRAGQNLVAEAMESG
jgi:arylformamidase